jgi:uncharacterized protein YrrD
MKDQRFYNVEKELEGKPVLAAGTGTRVGTVSDVLLDPSSGTFAGLVFAGTGTEPERVALPKDVRIGRDAIMLSPDSRFLLPRDHELDKSERALQTMVGSTVITEDGRVIGRVSEIYLSSESRDFAYRIAESGWQKLVGGGFFVAGQVPRAFSPEGSRLIVPADTSVRYAHSTLAEIFSSGEVPTGMNR